MKLLRKFEESDLELLLNFKNSLSPETRQWTLERAKRELMDFGRGYGENVLIEEDCEVISSFAGFVRTSIERGEFFIAPFVVKSLCNCILLEKLIAIARENKAKRIRASVYSEEVVKKNLLLDYQFYRAFDFITLSFDLCENKVVDSYPTIKLVKIPFDKLDPEKFAKLNNSAFKNVQNAAIIDSKQATEVFNSFHSYGKLGQVWGEMNIITMLDL